MKIATLHHRSNIWTAIDRDTYSEEGSPIGQGDTEQMAIDELLRKMERRASSKIGRPWPMLRYATRFMQYDSSGWCGNDDEISAAIDLALRRHGRADVEAAELFVLYLPGPDHDLDAAIFTALAGETSEIDALVPPVIRAVFNTLFDGVE